MEISMPQVFSDNRIWMKPYGQKRFSFPKEFFFSKQTSAFYILFPLHKQNVHFFLL